MMAEQGRPDKESKPAKGTDENKDKNKDKKDEKKDKKEEGKKDDKKAPSSDTIKRPEKPKKEPNKAELEAMPEDGLILLQFEGHSWPAMVDWYSRATFFRGLKT